MFLFVQTLKLWDKEELISPLQCYNGYSFEEIEHNEIEGNEGLFFVRIFVKDIDPHKVC
jgi:hypothetical protein